MGGGGFTSKPENLKLDKYLLSLSDKKKYIKYMRKYVVPFGRRNIINNFIKSKLT